MHDTAIIVTTFCGGNNPESKKHMTKTLCKYLKRTGYHICLVSHSPIDAETQEYVHSYIYDCDNSFQVNGIPNRQDNHGVAELTSVHNALRYLSKFQIKNFLKVSYDNRPDMDYHDLIQKCKALNKKVVTGPWGNNTSMGTHMYFSEIEFFLKTFSLNELHRCERDLEFAWYDSVAEKGLFGEVHVVPDYQDFLGYQINQYCHDAGRRVDSYPFE